MTEDPELRTPRYPVRLVALRTGLSPHVLRAWERRYGVVSPVRSEGGQRLYTELDIDRLRRLRRLTERGHAISRLARLPLEELARLEQETGPEPPAAPTAATSSATALADAREFTDAALHATRQYDAAELQAVLERAAVSLGVPVFLDRVIAPLLDRIGHGWADRSLSVAQEHLASDVVRRVLGWLLRLYEVNGSAPRLVVATPPGQLHELGALMAAAGAAAEGWGVTYLGPDLPVADLVHAAVETGARAVALSVVYPADDLIPALRAVRAGLPGGVALVLGGAQAGALRPLVRAPGVLVTASLAEFRALLDGLRDRASTAISS